MAKGTIREGLEYSLEILENSVQNAEDSEENALACLNCYELASDCSCPPEQQLLWPIQYVCAMLRTIIQDLAPNSNRNGWGSDERDYTNSR